MSGNKDRKAELREEYDAIPGRDDGLPKAIVWRGELHRSPSFEQVEHWVWDSVCEALDGCTVEPDGRCPHGAPSWLIALGMV